MLYSIKCCDGRFGALFICRSGKVATLSFLIISQPTTDFGVGVGKRGKGGWEGREAEGHSLTFSSALAFQPIAETFKKATAPRNHGREAAMSAAVT